MGKPDIGKDSAQGGKKGSNKGSGKTADGPSDRGKGRGIVKGKGKEVQGSPDKQMSKGKGQKDQVFSTNDQRGIARSPDANTDWDDSEPVIREKTQGQEKKKRSKQTSDDRAKDFLYCLGTKCKVRKHTEMGCAVVTLESESVRDAILKNAKKEAPSDGSREARPVITIKNMTLQLRAYVDKAAQEESSLDIFAAWGRKAEKQSPLSAAAVADAFDRLVHTLGDVIEDDVTDFVGPVTPTKVSTTVKPLAATSFSPQQTAAQFAAAQMLLTQQLLLQQQALAQQQMGQMFAAQMAMASAAANVGVPAVDSASAGPAQQPPGRARKPFKILDPGSGQEIPSSASTMEMRAGAQAFVPFFSADRGVAEAGQPTAWERKTLKIVDPKSGETISGISSSGMRVDARAFVPPSVGDTISGEGLEPGDYAPALEHKAFKIVDPNTGVSIVPPKDSGSRAPNTSNKVKD